MLKSTQLSKDQRRNAHSFAKVNAEMHIARTNLEMRVILQEKTTTNQQQRRNVHCKSQCRKAHTFSITNLEMLIALQKTT